METENCIEEETQINTPIGSKAGRIWLVAVARSSHCVCAAHLDSIPVL